VIAFAKALLAFREHGAGELSNGYLHEAHAAYPGIAEFLCGLDPMSSLEEVETQDVSFTEERADLLMRGWKDTVGAAAWVRRTLAKKLVASKDGFNARTADDFPNDPPWLNSRIEPLGDALELEPGDGQWRLIVQKNSVGSTAHTLAVMDEGTLVYARPFDEKPTALELRDSVLRSIADPLFGEPRKPQCILVGTKTEHTAVAKIITTVNVDCRVDDASADDQEIYNQMMGHLAIEMQRMIQSSAEGGSADPMTSAPKQSAEWLEEFAAEVSSIPVCEELWLLAVVRPPLFVASGPVPERPWMVILLDAESGGILHLDVREGAPSIYETLDFVRSAMRQPKLGPSRRPGNMIIASDFLRDSMPEWSSVLAATSIQIESESDVQSLAEFLVPGPPDVEEIFTSVIAELLKANGTTQSQLREIRGMDDSFLKGFFHRVAVFYRAKPWKLVQGDRPFYVTCQDWDRPCWACFIMGQLGQQLGVNLFDNLDDARAIATDRDSARYLNAAVIQYDEAHGAVPADVWNIERMGWELAGEQAYPFIVRIEKGKRFVSVTNEDLRVLNDILPHIPRFLDHPEDQIFEVIESGKRIQFGWK